jgi:hypothetical protein
VDGGGRARLVTATAQQLEREAAASLVGECPTRLHEEDRLILVPGLIAVRAWGLVWLVPTAALGLLLSRVMPAWATDVLAEAFLAASGQRAPMAVAELFAELVPVVLGAAAGLALASWRPAGLSPRAFALAWLRHLRAPGVAFWAPGTDYATPPTPPADGGRARRRDDADQAEEGELGWR